MYKKQGRDESTEEDYPTAEQWRKRKQEDYSTPAVYPADVGYIFLVFSFPSSFCSRVVFLNVFIPALVYPYLKGSFGETFSLFSFVFEGIYKPTSKYTCTCRTSFGNKLCYSSPNTVSHCTHLLVEAMGLIRCMQGIVYMYLSFRVLARTHNPSGSWVR